MSLFQKKGINRNIDWATFSLYLGLVMIGGITIYSVGYVKGQALFELSTPGGKQMIWALISFVALGVIILIDWKFWQTFAYPFYGLTLLSLVAVLLFGVEIKGQVSWFTIGGSTIQPSEFAKFGTILAMAAYLSSATANLRNLNSQLICFALMFAPIVLILLQPDLGSAIVFLSFFIVLYREGLSSGYYLLGIAVITFFILGVIVEVHQLIWIGLAASGALWLGSILFKKTPLYIGVVGLAGLTLWYLARMEYFDVKIILLLAVALFAGLGIYYTIQQSIRFPALLLATLVFCGVIANASNYIYYNNVLPSHQISRIKVWLHPQDADPLNEMYNLNQAQMAISSGRLTGKGLLEEATMTRLNYVPEQSTDFILSAIGEEQGFVGIATVIILFLIFMLRIVFLAERQRSTFSRIYAYSFAGIIFIHVFVNVGMTLGLAPVVGIPLPFISKGGSSLLSFTIMLGVLLKLDSNRFKI